MTRTPTTETSTTETPTTGTSTTRTLWRLADRHSRRLLLGVVGWRTAQSVAAGVPVLVVLQLIEAVRAGSLGLAAAGWATVACAVSLVAQYLCARQANLHAWIGGMEVVRDLRLAAVDRMRRLPLGFHLGRRSGDTVTALTSDTAILERFLVMTVPDITGALTLPLVVLVVLLVVDPVLALAAAVTVVLAAPVWLWVMRRMRALARRRQDVQAETTSAVLEHVQGLPTLRAFGGLGAAFDRLSGAVDRSRVLHTRLAVLLTPPMVLFGLVVELGIALVVLVGALRLTGGAVDAGTVIVFAVLVLRVYLPLVQVANEGETLRLAQASLARLDRIRSAPAQPQPAAPREPRGHDVVFRGVRFAYPGGAPVLDGLDLTVPAGRVTALVGPSGSGKSTILRLVSRAWDVEAGEVTIGGVDVRELSADTLFDTVSTVLQETWLATGTVRENIAMGRPDATDAEIGAAARAARLDLPLDTLVGEGGARLSGGERQRVCIARALLKDSPVLLLDEFTASLDATTERLVAEALRTLVAGRTVLVVAHRLRTIRSADEIVVLDGGRVAERGTHADLVAAGGPFARLWVERGRARGWTLGRSTGVSP